MPQTFALTLASGAVRQLTQNADVMPELTAAKRRTVTARRADGYSFTVKVTLPADYQDGTRLPAAVPAVDAAGLAYPLATADVRDDGAPLLVALTLPTVTTAVAVMVLEAAAAEGTRPAVTAAALPWACLLYTTPSPRDRTRPRMPSSA